VCTAIRAADLIVICFCRAGRGPLLAATRTPKSVSTATIIVAATGSVVIRTGLSIAR